MRKGRRRAVLVPLLALLAVAATLPAPAAEAPRATVLVLDVSGSMWSKLGGETRIEAARRALARLIRGLPAGSQVGIVAYGHRREADCKDIEVVAPLAPLAAEGLIAKVNALTPKGKTPIAAAVTAAFRVAADRPANVILVSDGLETCDPDPCATVARLAASDTDLVLHVVGFGLGGEESPAQLECLAQAGRGRYFDAADAAGLEAALNEASSAPPLAGEAVLEVGASADGKPADATVKVFPAGGKRDLTSGRTYTETATNPRRFALPAGRYDVSVVAINIEGASQRFTGIEIAKGRPGKVAADFSTGEIVVSVKRNGALSDATVQVLAGGKNVAQTRSYKAAASNPARFRVPAGAYEVVVRSVEIAGSPEVRRAVTLAPGATVEVPAAFTSGTLKVGATHGGALVDATVSVKRESGQSVDGCRTYDRPASNPCAFILPAGRYRVDVAAVRLEGRPKRTLAAEVAAEGEVSLTARFDGP